MAAPAIDHVEQNIARLLWQLREKPVFKGLVQSIGAELNEIETALAAIRDLTIATESGAQLDADGALVGIARAGRIDADYSAAIMAQIRINRGNAQIEDILYALSAGYPSSAFVLSEPDAARVRVDADSLALASSASLAQLLDAVVGGGIRHVLIASEYVASNTLTLSSDDTVQTSSLLGLGEDPPYINSIGGFLADAIS